VKHQVKKFIAKGIIDKCSFLNEFMERPAKGIGTSCRAAWKARP